MSLKSAADSLPLPDDNTVQKSIACEELEAPIALNCHQCPLSLDQKLCNSLVIVLCFERGQCEFVDCRLKQDV